jgi:putative transposase
MPNHVHGVIVINKPTSTDGGPNRFGPQSQNLASIVRGFKIGVTKYAREHQIPFAWQARYYDNIVRSTADYERISHYIVANPANWGKDKFYAA